MRLKMSYAERRPFYRGLIELSCVTCLIQYRGNDMAVADGLGPIWRQGIIYNHDR